MSEEVIDNGMMQRAIWTLATVGEIAVTKRTAEQETSYASAMKYVKNHAAEFVEQIGSRSWEIIRAEYRMWKDEGAFADLGLLHDSRLTLPVLTSNVLDSEIDTFFKACYAADGVLYEAFEQATTTMHRWDALVERITKLFSAAINLEQKHKAEAVFEVYIPADIRDHILELEIFIEALKIRLKRWEVARETISRLITHRMGIVRDPMVRREMEQLAQDQIGTEQNSTNVGRRYSKKPTGEA